MSAINYLRELKKTQTGKYAQKWLDMAIQALEQKPCGDTVSRGVFEQVVWERDTAIEQLRKLGYELGQKIESCGDCVSRQAVLKINENYHGKMPNHINFEIWNEIKALPPVLPKREQGEWIRQSWGYECSMCHGFIDGGWDNEADCLKPFASFCPHCGAEMR